MLRFISESSEALWLIGIGGLVPTMDRKRPRLERNSALQELLHVGRISNDGLIALLKRLREQSER